MIHSDFAEPKDQEGPAYSPEVKSMRRMMMRGVNGMVSV